MSDWIELDIEKIARKKLIEQLGENPGNVIYDAYKSARNNLVENVLDEIAKRQPTLTDHGIDHVRTVLTRISDLLGSKVSDFEGVELYALIKSALFHDVGNYYEREGHEDKTSEIYDFACGANANKRQEKSVVLRIIRAHCGGRINGSNNTLKDLNEEDQLMGKKVRLRELASILRFADEISEGLYRTSSFALTRGDYEETCQIFHEYAACVDLCVDRGNGRITLTYNIQVNTNNKTLPPKKEKQLEKLINFIFCRVIKCDEERQFTKYYCGYLAKFKSLSVCIRFAVNNIYHDEEDIHFTLRDRIIIPGEQNLSIDKYCPGLPPNISVRKIVKRIKKMTTR